MYKFMSKRYMTTWDIWQSCFHDILMRLCPRGAWQPEVYDSSLFPWQSYVQEVNWWQPEVYDNLVSMATLCSRGTWHVYPWGTWQSCFHDILMMLCLRVTLKSEIHDKLWYMTILFPRQPCVQEYWYMMTLDTWHPSIHELHYVRFSDNLMLMRYMRTWDTVNIFCFFHGCLFSVKIISYFKCLKI